MKFPEVIGSNLEFREFKLPYGFEAKHNIVIVPFHRSHQALVDQWAPYLSKLVSKFPDLEFYEIPTLSKGYKLMRFMIDGGMRAGIPNLKTRQRTITLYINKKDFKKQLNIQTEKTISLFLVNKNGEILWREQGGFTNQKAEELKKILFELNA